VGLRPRFRRPTPDFDTVNALFHSDHQLVTRTGALESAPTEGTSGFRSWLARIGETGDWQSELEDVRVAPDGRLVAIARVRIQATRGGSAIDLHAGFVIRVRDGKISRTETFESSRAALEAVGLRE